MFYFKACTKCQGDLTLESDSYGSFLKCMQCGKNTEVIEVNGYQSVLHGSATSEFPSRAVSEPKVKTAVAA